MGAVRYPRITILKINGVYKDTVQVGKVFTMLVFSVCDCFEYSANAMYYILANSYFIILRSILF